MNFLIADDSDFSRILLKKHLATLGYKVLAEAKSGKELVKLAKFHKPDFILTDVKMDNTSGIDAAIEILDFHPSCKIICVTAYNISGWISTMESIGISGYLYKNCNSDSIRNAVKAATNSNFYVDRPILDNYIAELKSLIIDEKIDIVEGIIHELEKTIKRDIIKYEYKPTDREIVILKSLAKGQKLTVIAEILGVSVRSITKVKNKLYKEYGVKSSNELIALASRVLDIT